MGSLIFTIVIVVFEVVILWSWIIRSEKRRKIEKAEREAYWEEFDRKWEAREIDRMMDSMYGSHVVRHRSGVVLIKNENRDPRYRGYMTEAESDARDGRRRVRL